MVNTVTLNNNPYNDGATGPGNMANGGHRQNFIACLSDMLVEIGNQVTSASNGYRATSTSTLSIGTGSKPLIVTANKAYAVGDVVGLFVTASPQANWMIGTITAFTPGSGAMTVSVATGDFQGSGSFSAWTVAGPVGPRGLRGLSGWAYAWDTGTTAADPGPGFIRASNPTIGSATAIYIDATGADAIALTNEIISWGASTNPNKGRLTLRSQAAPGQQASWDVTAVTDNTGWFTLTVSNFAGALALSAGDSVVVGFSRTGDLGATGPAGSNGTVSAANDGSVSAPGIAFASETGLGFRRVSPALMAVVSGGADQFQLTLATQAEAEAGTITNKLMNPQRTAQAIAALAASRLIRSARTTNTILGTADRGTFIDITSGTFTQTFTAAATLTSGWWVRIRNSGTGDITLDPNASETIDGLSSFIMYPGEVRDIQCNGTAFFSIVLEGAIRTFTSSGSVTWPPGYVAVEVDAIGGGGGGGSGGGGTSQLGTGGGGGDGGDRTFGVIASPTPGTTTTVTIGAGGSGGAGVSWPAVSNNGVNGGTTSLGTLIEAAGGSNGAGGSGAGAGGGGPSGIPATQFKGPRGGGGGGFNGTPSFTGGAGGNSGGTTGGAASGTTASTSTGTPGNAGTAKTAFAEVVPFGSAGGGAGGANGSVGTCTGNPGAAGGNFGAGGGGGSASLNAQSGAGGAGSPGVLQIRWRA